MRIDNQQSDLESVTKTLRHYPLLAAKTTNIVIKDVTPRRSIHEFSATGVGESVQACLAMLALLTHVTSLHIHSSRLPRAYRYRCPNFYVRTNEADRPHAAAFLPHLHSLFVRPADPTTDLVCIPDFASLMKHPGLDQISIYAGVLAKRLPAWSLDASDGFAPGSLRVTRLNLLGCCVDKTSLHMLVTACPGLKALRYSQLFNENCDVMQALGLDLSLRGLHPGPFLKSTPTAKSLSPMLEMCQDTLEELHISLQTVIKRMPLPGGKMVGLKNFRQLRSLSIQGHHLDMFADLPLSLERLTIQKSNVHSLSHDRERFFSASHSLQQICCPRLKSVVFDDMTLESDSLESHIFFQNGIAPGEWEHRGTKGLPCCYSWRVNNMKLTLRDPQNHDRNGLRWPIMLDESDVSEELGKSGADTLESTR